MPPVVTDAIVLHAFDYLESSRILKLVTRDAGVRSVLARGARRSKRRFGAALDLFAQGTAELQVKTGRDLDTLGGFDVTRARPQLAESLSRFAGANTIAELALRFGGDDTNADLFDTVAATLDAIAASIGDAARDATLAGAWRVLADLGVAPTIDQCAECHAPIDPDAAALFSHPAGGAVCARCGHLARSGRTLPPAARAALRGWLGDRAAPLTTLDANAAHAHQRLLREFVREHLADDRPLRAFENWEQETLMPRTAGGAA
ncbi:MAG TPA: DNA repair protein RecO [Gemmatimonadaceae bacterium]|nr:DNA repair protein RecO [Gemmatimonadaceae bacterium]